MNQEETKNKIEELKEKGNIAYSIALKNTKDMKIYNKYLNESLEYYTKGILLNKSNYILFSKINIVKIYI
jgi:hypothetical protein